MPFDTLRREVSRHPWLVVAGWAALALAVGLGAPNLTRLAAEGQAHLLPKDAESALAAAKVRDAWPGQAYESLAIVALHRPGGLTPADRELASRLAARFSVADRPKDILHVLGPDSPKEVAERLVSRDGTVQLLAVGLDKSFVGPSTQEAVRWLETQAAATNPPKGLLTWTGDAVFGRDYMADVQKSLDRAAVATVFLLLGVLLAVYRSLWLAAVPLVTIGVGLVISRGVLAWLAWSGIWEVSPLVELFLVVLLFGSGTDFCLFLSWRFGEHWDAADPAGAMRTTLKRAVGALITSAGTVIAGLTLMGFTRFKLFSSTGPSVALGLALTLCATLTLTPALLVLLARHHPKSFAGLTRPSSGFWDSIGHRVLKRPVATWLGTLAVMLPLAVLGMRTNFLQDTFAELPGETPSVKGMGLIAEKFGPGMVAPLTVVLTSGEDLRHSEGLALIDDTSRYLSHQRRLAEVRSATQPLGSTDRLERARLASRLGEVNEGFSRMAEGADQLREGLTSGATKIRVARQVERGLKRALSGFTGTLSPAPAPAEEPKGEDPRDAMVRELSRAAEGAGQIGDGARRARHEVSSILADPVGRRALDRLLITPETVRDNPELTRSFEAYLSADGKLARIDLTPRDRVFSAAALDQVVDLRRRLNEYVGEMGPPQVFALLTGPNAESADVRALTRADQYKTWIIVPLGVFLILLLALRDPGACLNLVATMILTYAFALGVTHLVFVDLLHAEGLDWKVPYFLFVLLVAVGVDYNVFLMARLQEESKALGLRAGITRAVAQTGGLISSAAAITACSFASFLFSPLGSLRQLGFALVVGITIDAALVRPVLVPCGQWLLKRRGEGRRPSGMKMLALPQMAEVTD